MVDVGEDWFGLPHPGNLETYHHRQQTRCNLVNLEFDQNTKIIVKTLDSILPEIEKRLEIHYSGSLNPLLSPWKTKDLKMEKKVPNSMSSSYIDRKFLKDKF